MILTKEEIREKLRYQDGVPSLGPYVNRVATLEIGCPFSYDPRCQMEGDHMDRSVPLRIQDALYGEVVDRLRDALLELREGSIYEADEILRKLDEDLTS